MALNAGKINQNKRNLFMGTCIHCVKYGHRAAGLWGNDNRNEVKHSFNK